MGLRGRSSLTANRIFFVTTTVVGFLNIFRDDKACQILLENIRYYQRKYKFIILAYVIMPSHFHWIIDINPELGTISDIMRDLKKYSAWDLMEYLRNKQNGPTAEFKEAAKGFSAKQNRKLWMPRFDDEVILNEKMFLVKLNYIHNNPVKAGLADKPEDYKFSSAGNYVYGDHSLINVNVDFG